MLITVTLWRGSHELAGILPSNTTVLVVEILDIAHFFHRGFDFCLEWSWASAAVVFHPLRAPTADIRATAGATVVRNVMLAGLVGLAGSYGHVD